MPSKRELAKIFAAAREVRLSEEQVRDVAEQVSGQRSISALDPQQTREVIDSLVRLGARGWTNGKKPSGRPRVPGVIKLITPEQRSYIQDLRKKLGEDWLRDEYFHGACGKVIGKPKATTAGDAARVIEMLRARLGYDKRRAGSEPAA
ncbi:phage protein GemA/Gp16 family protein [Longimicrobium sp.]|uniref:phage protein GemA/Gp16 family protein n=1 Tax=Longimicrobium sp. TaxID=2029185 RepID=UPI002E363C3D|nr:phage protein GemA/Gp16 family protein [Longimicrobium sp.]HEX6038951.1 phage protein GemA/Gp16 family protein [Longimicrobium sp.]